MRLFQVDLEYLYIWGGDSDESKAKKLEEIHARIRFLREIGAVIEDMKDDESNPQNLILNGDQVLALQIAGYAIKKIREIQTPKHDLAGAMAKFNEVADKMLALPTPERVFNEKVEVHIPGQALATYNETLLLEDSCTDVLQSNLDSGWRIIAVCPQAQRRPDYILGRFNPSRKIDSSALRSIAI